MKLAGENRNTRSKTCPIATLSTTNPTWTDPRSNPGLRYEQATNRLNRGTAHGMRFLRIMSAQRLWNYTEGECNEFERNVYTRLSNTRRHTPEDRVLNIEK
jgi:hypothetical protein